jgi:MFS family permease
MSIFIQLRLLPLLARRVGEHATCALGLLLISVAFSSCSLVRVQPYHALLFLASRMGLALVDTTTTALVARYSLTPTHRDQHFGMLIGVQAVSSIVAPVLAGKLYQRSLKTGGVFNVFPGAAPFILTAALALLACPVVLLLGATDRGWIATAAQHHGLVGVISRV